MLGAHIGGTVLTGDAKSCVIVVSCVKAMGGHHKMGSYTIDVQRWFKTDFFFKILGEPTRTS